MPPPREPEGKKERKLKALSYCTVPSLDTITMPLSMTDKRVVLYVDPWIDRSMKGRSRGMGSWDQVILLDSFFAYIIYKM